MKKALNITFPLLLVMITLVLSACGKTPSNETNSNEQTQSEANARATEKSPENPVSAKEIKSVTLEADNEYYTISEIDFSDCKYEDGLFSGYIKFHEHTTQKYIDEYSEYFYRRIFFGFYAENGRLVTEESAQSNCVYSREYQEDDSNYVVFTSNSPITEVKVTKIVIETPAV